MKIKTLLLTASAILFLSGSALADTIIHETNYVVPQDQIQNVHLILNVGKSVNAGSCQFMHQIDYTYNTYYNGETLVLPASDLTKDTHNYRWTCAREDYSYSVNGQIKHVYEDYKISVVDNDYKSSVPFKGTVVLK